MKGGVLRSGLRAPALKQGDFLQAPGLPWCARPHQALPRLPAAALGWQPWLLVAAADADPAAQQSLHYRWGAQVVPAAM